ncbi:benzoate 4-monooxygenase cytochrome P450 [Microdochium bolleyi]|uniref:Benzoate 4-monooxygenase cytochrome P450 n=1 Tax=Microdochium bolleyi TaxID=196109 RepID=A0A136IK50_9PEZI|nr:benzoate 4-monooxygenase cytochrome P450 [Microdochium bolleyi]
MPWTIYSVIFHQLASFPGPRFAAISRFPYWIQVFRGRDQHWVHALHEKYGPVVRYGPTDLSFSSAQAWRDVYGHVKGRSSQAKADDYGLQPANGVRSILMCNDENHARVRRIFAPAFSDRALRKQEHIFKRYVELLVEKVEQAISKHEDSSPRLEMTKYMNYVTFDLSPWVASIFAMISLLPISLFMEYYPLLSSLLRRFEPKWLRDIRDEHFNHSVERVDQRLREGSDGPDIWNLVMNKTDSGEQLTLGEMHSNADVFMLAGTETTATLLSGLLYYLGCSSAKLQRLAHEIRNSHDSVEDMTFDSLARLPYLNACVKEGLRIYPPVPSGAPRIVQDCGVAIAGQWVAGGTRVLFSQYAAHHSSANFGEPGTFAPERWLKDENNDSNRFTKDDKEARPPFGLGPRSCLGKSMALHESKLILAALLFRFDFRLAEDSRGWMDQKAHALWVKPALVCHVSLHVQ